MLSNGVTVTVTEIRNGQVKLGFVAPPDTTIRRAELLPRPEEAGEQP